jgi:phospholipase C
VFQESDGNPYHTFTTVPDPNGHPARTLISPNHTFAEHNKVSVTFENINPFPINFSAFVEIQSPQTLTITEIPKEMIDRLFGDTLKFLTPTFSVHKGKFFIGFNNVVLDALDIETVEIDVGLNAEASAEIESDSMEIFSTLEVITIMANELKAECEANIERAFALDPQSPDAQLKLPIDFVDLIVSTYFQENVLLTFSGSPLWDLFIKPNPVGMGLGLHSGVWLAPFSKRSILSGKPDPDRDLEDRFVIRGKKDDIAICFNLKASNIVAEAKRLDINVETITAKFYLVLSSGSTLIAHPDNDDSGEPMRDSITVGKIIPSFHLSVDISHIDVDLEIGDDVFSTLEELVVGTAAEALINWFRHDFEDLAVNEGINFLYQNFIKIGDLASQMFSMMANKHHYFRRASTDESGWIIETLDPGQVAVPFSAPDPIDHNLDGINDAALPPLIPIDGPMPTDAKDKLNHVEHLVFLMMENRSFDQMLGYLSHPDHGARDDIDGLDGEAVDVAGELNGGIVPQPNQRHVFFPNPGHSEETVARQINDGEMNGFYSEFEKRLVKKTESGEISATGNLNDAERIYQFYTSDDLKTYDRLSNEEVILDRWFCSIPGGTFPNRSCYYSGTTPFLNNDHFFNDAGYINELTLFDVLDHANVSWKVYESSISFLRMFDKYRLNENNIRQIEEMKLSDPDEDFVLSLPKVTFIDPDFKGSPTEQANDDHAPTDITHGQNFIESVINRLKKNEVAWKKTMLVIIYDEHGGFADHIPPPGTTLSDFHPENCVAKVPLGHPEAGSYGVRIPAFVVSPLVNDGAVGHKIYDHATVFRTILERFMPELVNSPVIPERVRRARHLGELITRGIEAEGGVNPIAAGLQDPLEPPTRRKPDVVISNMGDSARPFLAEADEKDFHEFLTRLGNPIMK